MALALLAHEWAQQRGGRITALTVDHSLRSESAHEAQQVGQWCAALGIEHHILTWTPPDVLQGIQNAARNARYGLLSGYCRQHHIPHLLTGHQREDQTETLFFRLARGSGMAGLAGMAAVSDLNGIRLLRPLLSVPKQRLVATLNQRHHPWIEDPSNQKSVYTRNHIRLLLAQSPDSDALHNRAQRVSEYFTKFNNLLNKKVASCLTDAALLFPEGYATLKRSAFSEMPHELALRSLSALVTTLSGLEYAPRTEKLERFLMALSAPVPTSKRSFSGLLFQFRAKSNDWLVYREPNALEGPIEVRPATSILWDRRFLVECHGIKNPVSVRALGREGLTWLKCHEPPIINKNQRNTPKMVLASLPSFWHLEEMIAVPHIDYLNHHYTDAKFTAQFTPPKPLVARAF